jgi:hypothetical protein
MEKSIGGLEGSNITYYCQLSQNYKRMVATCLSNGSWSPDPREMECPSRNTTTTEIYATVGDSYSSVINPLNLVLVLSVSFVICSLFILLCGLLLGILLSRCYLKRVSSKNRIKSPPAPIYEEVIIQTCNELNSLKLEDNVAYGPIQCCI